MAEAAVSLSIHMNIMSPCWESNSRPVDLQSETLTTELASPAVNLVLFTVSRHVTWIVPLTCSVNTMRKQQRPWPRHVYIFALSSMYEPRYDKTNKLSVRPAKTQISLGIRPAWSESSLCAQWVAMDPSFIHADSEDSDHTGRMHRLIWVFAGRTLILFVLSCRGPYVYLFAL